MEDDPGPPLLAGSLGRNSPKYPPEIFGNLWCVDLVVSAITHGLFLESFWLSDRQSNSCSLYLYLYMYALTVRLLCVK